MLNCSRFFEYSGVRVLGGIFNKLALEGFYNVESCRSAITSYFTQYRPSCKPYGFVPVMIFENSSSTASTTDGTESEVVSPTALETFMSHVMVRDIVHDALTAQVGTYSVDFHAIYMLTLILGIAIGH